MNERIGTTWFRSLRDPEGIRVRLTWSALVSNLATPRVVAKKHDAAGMSLATYRDDRRSLANVERVFAVGLDLDEAVHWDDLRTKFAASSAFLHTTWSATLIEPRARVFLRLSRPVTTPEYRRVFAAVASRVEGAGLIVDRAASDPSRFWFVPSIASPPSFFRCALTEGKPVDVDSALVAFPEQAPPPVSVRPTSAAPASDVEARAAAYLERCDPAISGSGGSTTTLRVATKLVIGFGLDEATAYRLLTAWNARCSPPWSERDLRRKVAQASEHGGRVMAEGALRDARREPS